MTDDYLWDRTGRDEEVERLESLLAPLAFEPRTARVAPAPRRGVRAAAQLAAAAVVAAIFILGPDRADEYEVARERREVDLGAVGRVEMEANSRWRVLSRTEELVKLRLQVGTMRASISASARPRLFQVETPSTTCVDLGCHYTLAVTPDGVARVSVTLGRVAFVDGGREVYVPSGASCTAWRGRGSGTPVFDDAPAAVGAAVRAYDESGSIDRLSRARAVIDECRRRDEALTLWHIMQDGDRSVGEAAYDAIVALVGAAEGATREGTLGRTAEALQAWKRHLGWW